MLSIAANISEIIAELESAAATLQRDLIPSVMNPELYLPHLKSTAHTVLVGLMSEEENPAMEYIEATIMGAAVEFGMYFEASGGIGGGGEPGEPTKEFDTSLIEQWVAEQKEKTEDRDFYKGAGKGGRSTHVKGDPIPNDVIADRIIAITNRDPNAFFRDGKHSENGLADFLASHAGTGSGEGSGLTGLSEERLTELLAAVLNAWQETMGARVQDAALAEIDKAFGIKL